MTGPEIVALRTRLGITQQHLATHLGLSTSAWQKWECGTQLPRGSTLTLLRLLAAAESAAGAEAVARGVRGAGHDPLAVVKVLARLAG